MNQCPKCGREIIQKYRRSIVTGMAYTWFVCSASILKCRFFSSTWPIGIKNERQIEELKSNHRAGG